MIQQPVVCVESVKPSHVDVIALLRPASWCMSTLQALYDSSLSFPLWHPVNGDGLCWSVIVDLNAVTRSLDLSCKILSPTVAGIIMTYASLLVSAVVIAVWNVFSLVAEYAILSRVYQLVPDLAVKHRPPSTAAAGQLLLAHANVHPLTPTVAVWVQL